MVDKNQIIKIMGLFVVIIVSIFIYFYLNQWAGLIAFIIGFIGIYLTFVRSKKKDEERYQRALEDITSIYSERNKELTQKSEELKKDKAILRYEKRELKKILNKINDTMKKENISKEELIEKIDTPLRMMLLMKTSEDISNKRFILRDKALPEIGFKYFDKGIYVLPPTKTPQLKNKEEIKNWLKNRFKKYIGRGYEHIIQMATVIDLRKIYYEKNVPSYRRGRTIIDALSPEDLIPIYKVLKYLKDKKNISLYDIIEIPSIPFLVDELSCSRAEFERLRKNNEKILHRLGKLSKIEKIRTTDLATMDKKIFELALTGIVKKPEKISEIIIENAQFWKSYFEGKVESSSS